jgi:hypothetical protein
MIMYPLGRQPSSPHETTNQNSSNSRTNDNLTQLSINNPLKSVMASPGSRPSPAPSTPGSQAPAASPAAAINPATKKKEITAVQAAKAKAMK